VLFAAGSPLEFQKKVQSILKLFYVFIFNYILWVTQKLPIV